MKLTSSILIIILFGTLAWNVQAGEFSTSVGQRSMDAGDDSFTVVKWDFARAIYKLTNSNFYFGISQEEAEVAPVSYFSWTYGIKGLFAGIESDLTKNISFFAHLGLYIIDNDMDKNSDVPEGVGYYFDSKFKGATAKSFDQVTLINSNAFGGTAGIKLIQPITKNLKLGFSISKRLLKINETLSVRFKQNHDWFWEVQSNRDYSSTNFAMNVTYAF